MRILSGILAFGWGIFSLLFFLHKLPEPNTYLLGGLVTFSLFLINGHRAFEHLTLNHKEVK